ncbi:MAG: hypothetical protein ACREFP_02760 [Acetobacteraceae bacterium]
MRPEFDFHLTVIPRKRQLNYGHGSHPTQASPLSQTFVIGVNPFHACRPEDGHDLSINFYFLIRLDRVFRVRARKYIPIEASKLDSTLGVKCGHLEQSGPTNNIKVLLRVGPYCRQDLRDYRGRNYNFLASFTKGFHQELGAPLGHDDWALSGWV